MRVTVPCEEQHGMHKIEVHIDRNTHEIVRRSSPCSLHQFSYELAECAAQPRCIETFDAIECKDATLNPWIIRELMLKRHRFTHTEETILRAYARKVLTKPCTNLSITQRALVGLASSRQAYRILIETAHEMETLYPECIDSIQALNFNLAFEPIRRDKIECFAELNAIAIERADPTKPYPTILLTHPIIQLGELAGAGKCQAVERIWQRLKPAYTHYFQQRPNEHREKIIEQLVIRFQIGCESERRTYRRSSNRQCIQPIIEEIKSLTNRISMGYNPLEGGG